MDFMDKGQEIVEKNVLGVPDTSTIGLTTKEGFLSRGKKRGLALFSLAAILVGSGILYLSLLAPGKFGEYHDDSIYVSTAKALATGQGYKIISLPYVPAQTKYPPFYPFLLSLIWKVYPQFPQNVMWMMLLSVSVMLGFLALTYWYFIRNGYSSHWQALIIVALVATNWRTLTIATGIYSEAVYALLSLAVLFL